MSSISVKNLAKSYGEGKVLADVSFEVEKGTIFALLGSNGAGKTTMINILSTLLSASSGEVTVAGYGVRTDSKKVRQHISLTGQYAAIDDLLTGEENLHMMGRLSRIEPSTIKPRTVELLRQFDLEKAAKKRVSTYSGGMQRKLDLAISLLASPSIIFLDEPTTGLDPRSRQELWRLIRDLAKNGTTILLTTQYLDEADYLADKIAVLNEGKIVAQGTPTDLKKRVGGEYVDLVFSTQGDRDKALKLLTHSMTTEIETYSLSVPTTGKTSDIRKLLNTLADAQLEPQSITTRKPTLDDVFMQLTGTEQHEEGK